MISLSNVSGVFTTRPARRRKRVKKMYARSFLDAPEDATVIYIRRGKLGYGVRKFAEGARKLLGGVPKKGVKPSTKRTAKMLLAAKKVADPVGVKPNAKVVSRKKLDRSRAALRKLGEYTKALRKETVAKGGDASEVKSLRKRYADASATLSKAERRSGQYETGLKNLAGKLRKERVTAKRRARNAVIAGGAVGVVAGGAAVAGAKRKQYKKGMNTGYILGKLS